MLNKTAYYDEFIRYCNMADWQHEHCNLGTTPHEESPFDDDLMKNVHLYDVAERKFAGFCQLMLDVVYPIEVHPRRVKVYGWRRKLIDSFNSVRGSWDLEEWFYIYFVHRLTGSGIDYGSSTMGGNGYRNSIIPKFSDCHTVSEMVDVVKGHKGVMFTSKGYQIASFPKPGDGYEKGGIFYMCEELPLLIQDLVTFLRQSNAKPSFRECMAVLDKFQHDRGYRRFTFHFGAALADIADFNPGLIDEYSPYFAASNGVECASYLAVKPRGMSPLAFLDSVLDEICKDVGGKHYDREDVLCDSIRWMESLIDPRGDYSHLCMDTVFSSHQMDFHPYGRQKAMLELGLVETFNGSNHPSDDKIIKAAGITVEQYQNMIVDRL